MGPKKMKKVIKTTQTPQMRLPDNHLPKIE